ncbi:MAG: endonuclease V [bacterium]|nr:endonuclease V [bacterium]
MKLAVDVLYRENRAQVAAILFADWADPGPLRTEVLEMQVESDYVPGEFYRRELPCIRNILADRFAGDELQHIVIDGFVYLDQNRRAGLGAHLYRELNGPLASKRNSEIASKENGSISVIGVAKTAFHGMQPHATETDFYRTVRRGESQTPLYITATGLDLDAAADAIQSMHGKYRMPTLLKQLDRLTRD